MLALLLGVGVVVAGARVFKPRLGRRSGREAAAGVASLTVVVVVTLTRMTPGSSSADDAGAGGAAGTGSGSGAAERTLIRGRSAGFSLMPSCWICC